MTICIRDESAELLKAVTGREYSGISIFWLLFKYSEFDAVVHQLAALGELYAWTVQEDTYSNFVHPKIRDFKSAFGKISNYNIGKDNIVYKKKTKYLDRTFYFDLFKIKNDDFIYFFSLAELHNICFMLSLETNDESPGDMYRQIYRYALEEQNPVFLLQSKRINIFAGSTLDGEGMLLLFGDRECMQTLAESSFKNNKHISASQFIDDYVSKSTTLTPVFSFPKFL